MVDSPATTILLVDLSVESDKQQRFDSFYQDIYVPELLKATPDIVSARRYVQKDLLTGLDAAEAHYLTIFELASEDRADATAKYLAGSADLDGAKQFELWKQDGLTYFDQAFYSQVYRHPRQPEGPCWAENSLYALRWIVDTDASAGDDQFNCADYFNRQMNNVMAWLACRTYVRTPGQPQCFLTVFEAADQVALRQALADDDQVLSEQDQIDFTDWVENSLTWHDCLMLEPIFAYHRSN